MKLRSSVILRPYQDAIVRAVREHIAAGRKRILIQLPTGGGKTLTAGYMLGGAAERGHNSMFICNRVELVGQTHFAFDRLDIATGIIAAGFTGDMWAPVQIASIDTLKRRLARVKAPKIIVWDECRGLGAAGWTAVFEAFPDAIHIGLDATPIRLDGKGLGRFFEVMVCGPTYSELISAGALVPCRAFAPSTPDMSAVKTKLGEFDQAQTEDVMDRPTITGDIVDHFVRHAGNKQGLTFAVSRRHSEHLAAQYCARGVIAEHLDGETDKAERNRKVAAYRRREIQMLTNVNLFSAGFDAPGVEVIVDAAPTQSLAQFIQRGGRGSRPEESIGKTYYTLLDHAGNCMRHGGLPDADRDWTLEDRPKKKKKAGEATVGIRQCVKCYGVFPPGPVCPYCGTEQPVASRELEQVAGELQEITPEMAKAMAAVKKEEVRKARTLDALEGIAEQRGYAAGWARQVFHSRQKSGQRRAEAQYEAFRR